MKVPWSRPNLFDGESQAVRDVIASGWLGMGPQTKSFEKEISNYLGGPECVLVNNGTSALLAAYLAHDLSPGDEVLVPTFTFAATLNALVVLGVRPILMDCDPSTFTVTPDIVTKGIRGHPKLKGIVIVDVAGNPCDIDTIRSVASESGLPLIEDAAEAFGVRYRDRMLGSYDHVTIFSFHIAKPITSVEGGAVVTTDRALADRCRRIRSHGEGLQKYVHVDIGLNLRPTDIQSAIGRIQLRKADQFIECRTKIAQFYRERLGSDLKFQAIPSYATRPTWMMLLALAGSRTERDALVTFLKTEGIEVRVPWPPAHQQPYLKDRLRKGSYPVADRLFQRGLTLPMGNGLTQEEVHFVTDAVSSFYRKGSG